jgi:hypothetical protein
VRGGGACQGSWVGYQCRGQFCGGRPDCCSKEKELGLVVLAVGFGPLPMRPIIILPNFGVLRAKIITPGFSPLQ